MIQKLKLLDEKLDMVLLSSGAFVASTKRKRLVIEICEGSDVYVFEERDARIEFGSRLDAINHDMKPTIVYGLETCTFMNKPGYKDEIDFTRIKDQRTHAKMNATVCTADDEITLSPKRLGEKDAKTQAVLKFNHDDKYYIYIVVYLNINNDNEIVYKEEEY